ncbi:hypothetical protein [Actinosynnema sp. NPDC020468]|uniref:YqeB family protein n=1 Tax=Actinosynnema sp. NPDC020468 TaxID=3154488 RepID=UPI0033E4CF37
MRTTSVAEPGWQVGLVWTAFPVLGAALVYGVKAAAGWVAGLAWAPAQGLFRLISTIPEPAATLGAVGLGLAGGLVISFIAAAERLRVEVADEQVVLDRGGQETGYDRTAISGVFLDGKKLVLLGLDSAELAREGSDLDAGALSDAFQSHGYPWLPEDPHRDEYRRWVRGIPELPAGADALLHARAEALRKGEEEDVALLRAELARLGVVVREEKKRQFWRLARRG